MFEEQEHFFDCPFCGVEISILIDPSASRQAYVEDCEVCCNPINISFRIVEDDVIDFLALTDD